MLSPAQSIKASKLKAAEKALEKALALAGFDSDQEEWAHFGTNLLTTLADRLHSTDVTAGAVAPMFVFVSRPNEYSGVSGAFRVIDVDRENSVALAGHLFIMGRGANAGFAIPIKSQADALAIIASEGLGCRPAATAYLNEREARLFPQGVDNPEVQVPFIIGMQQTVFSLERVVDTITEFHSRLISIPEHTNPGFWANSSQWLPASQAEKNIQWPMRAALIFAFRPSVVVREEEPNQVGDVDFVFYAAKSAHDAPPLAIVEAKIQKSRRENGDVPPSETAKEYIRGLIQCAAYRRAKNASWSMLACFDLREPGAGTDEAWLRATKRSEKVLKGLAKANRGGAPVVRTWMAYANTQAAQAAQATAAALYTDDPLYPVTKRPDYLRQLQSDPNAKP